MKRIIAAIVSVLMILPMIASFPLTIAAKAPKKATPTLRVSSATITETTETSKIDVTIENNPGIYATQIFVIYDEAMSFNAFSIGDAFESACFQMRPDKIKAIRDQSVDETAFFKYPSLLTQLETFGVDYENKKLTLVQLESNNVDEETGGPADVYGNGKIFSITLNTASLDVGTYPISVVYALGNTANSKLEDVSFEIENGRIVVEGCTHQPAGQGVVTAPTCTTSGYTTYTCRICGKEYKGDYKSSLGHSFDEVVTAPTYSAHGYTTYTCSKCGYSYIGNYKPALNNSNYTGVDSVDAKYFDVKPEIDGIVSEAEWGAYTIELDQSTAANIESTKPKNSSFFMRNTTAVPGYDSETLYMSYKLWVRWDEDNFYVAAIVKDPDGHSLKNNQSKLTAGDALQFKIDPYGYNASSPAGPDNYSPSIGMPWSQYYSDFAFGFTEYAGGFTEAWDNLKDVGISSDIGGVCQASVAPAGASFSSDTNNGYTTYEIAIPWSSIDEYGHEYASFEENENGAIGTEYGLSACVFNADGFSGARTWNAALSWGSGILEKQQEKYTSTCAGSNRVTLVADKVSADKAYNTSFTKIPGGYIPPAVNPMYAIEIDKTRHIGPIEYDTEDDLFLFGRYIGGEWKEDTDGNGVVFWDEDSLMASGLNEASILSTDEPTGGFLFDGEGNYTMEFDIKVTGTEDFLENEPSGIFNAFGGWSARDYKCGYNFDTCKFCVVERETDKILAEADADFTLNEWHHWVFQYFKDNCEIRFYFDPEMVDGVVSKNAEPLFRMSYRYFDMPGIISHTIAFLRTNCQIMLDNVQFYNFVDTWRTPISKKAVFCLDDPCGHFTTLIGEYETGETVNLPVPEGYANGNYFYRFFTWVGSSDYGIVRSAYKAGNGTANGRTYSFVKSYGTAWVSKQFILVGDIDLDGSITSKDLATMKDVLVNGVYYDDIVLEAVDMDGDGSLTSGDVQAFKEYMVGKFEITK